ncbi:MAG: hypothetical protein OXC46_01885 [Thaumarchaeota archaeon]|nr:hypothetical protein [Nitrososphaerota archaeon]
MNPNDEIKEFLFDYIKKSETRFSEMLSKKQYHDIIADLLENCRSMVNSAENTAESTGILATGILHYILTQAQIPSQRKAEINGIKLDIIIPDAKTLLYNPQDALLICIPLSTNQNEINQILENYSTIQPIRQNIWTILEYDHDIQKTYTTHKNPTLPGIINDMIRFTNLHCKNKLKILGV